jgi:hypothetical protein
MTVAQEAGTIITVTRNPTAMTVAQEAAMTIIVTHNLLQYHQQQTVRQEEVSLQVAVQVQAAPIIMVEEAEPTIAEANAARQAHKGLMETKVEAEVVKAKVEAKVRQTKVVVEVREEITVAKMEAKAEGEEIN